MSVKTIAKGALVCHCNLVSPYCMGFRLGDVAQCEVCGKLWRIEFSRDTHRAVGGRFWSQISERKYKRLVKRGKVTPHVRDH